MYFRPHHLFSSGKIMTARTRILLIGVEPIMADFRRLPALNAEKIMAALNIDKAKLSDYIGQVEGRNPWIYSAFPVFLGLLWTAPDSEMVEWRDRKSTRLNSSH